MKSLEAQRVLSPEHVNNIMSSVFNIDSGQGESLCWARASTLVELGHARTN